MMYYLILKFCFLHATGFCQVFMVPQPYRSEKECIVDGFNNIAKSETGDAGTVTEYYCIVRSDTKQ